MRRKEQGRQYKEKDMCEKDMCVWHGRFTRPLVVLTGGLTLLVGVSGLGGAPAAAALQPSVQPPIQQNSTLRGSAVAPQANFEQQLTNQLVGLINSNRKSRGLKPYTLDSGLATSAANHSALMADRKTLSHQLSGEASPGDRIKHYTGYQNISSWGENVGMSSKVSPAGVDEITKSMINEGPNGGHYKNLFSKTFTRFGAVVMSSKDHKSIWLTEDFIALRS